MYLVPALHSETAVVVQQPTGGCPVVRCSTLGLFGQNLGCGWACSPGKAEVPCCPWRCCLPGRLLPVCLASNVLNGTLSPRLPTGQPFCLTR